MGVCVGIGGQRVRGEDDEMEWRCMDVGAGSGGVRTSV